MPYSVLQQFLDEEYPHGRHYYWKSAAVAELTDPVVDIVADFAARQPSSLSTIDVWLMGGALRDEPAGGSAYSGRTAGYLVNPEADWDEVDGDEANVAWARELIEALRPHTVGTYLNFPGLLEEGEAQLRAGFGDNFERLTHVKTRSVPRQPVQAQPQRAAAAAGECSVAGITARSRPADRAAREEMAQKRV